MLTHGARNGPTHGSGASSTCCGSVRHDVGRLGGEGAGVKAVAGIIPPVAAPKITIHPVTPDRWDDLKRLFGPGGASGGCWCMWFRRRASEFAKAKARDNKADLKNIVEQAEEPGLIAYVDGEPAGWVSLDRRERYPRIEHSRLFPRLDDKPVWSIVCFVIGKTYRRTGLSARLLTAAIDYARKHGATMLEAYPIEPSEKLTGDRGFQGIRTTFDRAGFREAARASNGRPIMRRALR